MFLNSMFQQMFTDISGDGPFGGGGDRRVALVPHRRILQDLRQGRRHRTCRRVYPT